MVMNKKIKILSILNLISYVLIFSMNFLFDFNDLSNIKKFIVGNLPLVFIMITSFILASDFDINLKAIKIRAWIDWIVRIISFSINSFILMGYLEKSYLVLILILLLSNIFIEIEMNKKLNKNIKKSENKVKEKIYYKEKCNLGAMVKSTSSLLMSFLIFSGGALSVATLKNMEGTEENWYFPVIVSIVIALWFIKSSYNSYIDFYLDKDYAKNLFLKNSILSLIGYLVCLLLSFVNLEKNIYDYIFFIGILFSAPTIKTIRKMSLRLKEIKDNLGNEDYNYFVTKEFLGNDN